MSQKSHQVQTHAQQQLQTLSPQQILVVKLLELPAAELEDRVRGELLENPALEESPDADTPSVNEEVENEGDTSYDALDDYRTDDDIPDYRLQDNNRSPGERFEEIPFSAETSFYEVLKEQLGERNLNEQEAALVDYLIGSLDDDGLLRKSLTSIQEELAIYMGIDCTLDELEAALAVLHDFDPPGIGARSLQECLLIQLHRRRQESQNASLHTAERILTEGYEDFTRKHWDKLLKRLDLAQEELDEAISEITKLNPRPGSALGENLGRNLQQILPDFIVESSDDGSIGVSLNNGNVPTLRMSREFCDMVDEHTRNKANQSKESREAMLFLKQKMDAAQGFIDAIKQRQHTLLSTMQAIVDLQRPFFLEGDEGLLRPMILKDVAEKTGLDISTISRVSNSKYVQTNFGIYPLKFFFGDGYVNEAGEETSVREVKRILKEVIEAEDSKKPLTDDELSALLKAKGYPIARRTVAKYREQLRIPVARLRK
ncbi:MAG: RNA polymerase factor sigma-54 [Bacteroides sp.]|nr:RNA polymerase factor sigma-54 [Bacteroides sp.]